MEFRNLDFKLAPEVSPDGHVGVLTINRPQALNALNRDVIDELTSWVQWAAEQPSLRSVVITGAGEKAFVAGADIKEMKEMSAKEALAMSHRGQRLFEQLEELKLVTIAAINGFALGGGLELAMACDILLASENARFGLPEVSLGLIPGYGGTQRLSRYVGKAAARMVALSGDMFSAQQGYEWGLFAKVTPQAELLASALKLAKTIASRGPVAVSLAKRAINQGYDLAQVEAMGLEAEYFAKTFASNDHNEGIAAFIEKRSPQFKGN